MSTTSTTVPSPIRRILAPFLRHAKSWTLHYPVYLNTFCLAHHLAACFAEKGVGADDIRQHFVRNDWWHGRPRFNYKTDIEIFVGVEETIDDLKKSGHQIGGIQMIEFTSYNVAHVFQRLDGNGNPRPNSNGLPPIIVTDVYTTAKLFRESICDGSLSAPGILTSADAESAVIRNSWDREIGDFFAENPKIYLFGAPMTHILLENSKNFCSAPKYEKQDIAMKSIKTYYVMRCNSPIRDGMVISLGKAIKEYYDYLYSHTDAVDPSLPDRYARIALTSGEANPFPEIYQFERSAGPRPLTQTASLVDRYRDILARHHA
ncbi:MAG: hypothetical protein JWR84_1721 [Caulobacter sp.]|nr:hypothetical protein [Caulobacter sp.]